MATFGKCALRMFLVAIFVSLLGVHRVARATEQTDNMFDPVSSIYIRQEAALRKLDTLLAKVSPIESLESKLSYLAGLLEAQKDTNQVLETKMDAMEHRMNEIVEEVKNVNMTLKQMSVTVSHLENQLQNVSIDEPSECLDLSNLLSNVSDEFSQSITNQTTNLTLSCEIAIEEIKRFAEDIIVNVTMAFLSNSVDNSSVMAETLEKLLAIEELLISNANATKHLFSATFSRIRISNLAMDKRLAALLHMSSERQRVLQDSLLRAMTSVAALVKTQGQDIVRKTDKRMDNLEQSLASAIKVQANELATVVANATNRTQGDLSLAMLGLEDLLQIHLNQSVLLDAALEALKEALKEYQNQTLQSDTVEAPTDLCLFVVGPNQTDNATIEFKTSVSNSTLEFARDSLKQLEDSISAAHSELSQQVSAIADQLLGIRIYYSTSLHMSTDQIVSAMDDLRKDINMATEDTLAKSTENLENLRLSSMGILDAAVTSISSSAVASAQAAADQLEDALKGLESRLEEKLEKLQSAISPLKMTCPSQYTKVGNTCLLAFHDARTSWDTARDLCQQEDGDLVVLPDDNSFGHLKSFLYTTHAKDSTPPPPYWVGARKLDAKWVWANGSDVSVEIGKASWVDEDVKAESDSSLHQEKCLMAWGAAAELVPTSCESLRAVLCQHQPTRLTLQSPTFPKIIPQTTREPYIIIDPAQKNEVGSDGNDYLSYFHP